MTRNAQDIIDDMRNIVKPRIAKMLLEANFEGCGKEDKAEFETEFEIILTLAEKALEQEPCEDAISRQAVLNKAFEIKTGKNTSAMVVYAEDIRKELPVKPKLAFNERITTIPMPFE